MIDFVLSVGTATTSSTATEMTVTSVIPHHSMQRSLLAFFKPATPAAAPPAPQPAPPAASALPAARKPLRGKRHVEPVEPAATTPKSAPPAPAIAPPADVQRSHAAVEPVVAASAAVLSGSQAVADSTVTPDVAAANRADPAIRWAPQAETATAEPTADTAATDNASASEDEQDDDLDYETQRLRNINENRRWAERFSMETGPMAG